MIKLTDFEVAIYPDGHKHIKSNLDLHKETSLVASIKNFDDLFLIAQIKSIHPELTHLRIVYLLAARCDRRFSPGEAVDLKIVLDFITSLKFESVSVLHPHNAKVVTNYGLQDYYIDRPLLIALKNKLGVNFKKEDACFVGPDDGVKKYIEESPTLRFQHKCFFSKTRSKDGKIEITGDLGGYDRLKNYVIVDDLCDGGGTFSVLANKIKATNPNSKIYLMVTHGIFSKGFDFAKDIDLIVCSNSFSNVTHEKVIQVPVI